MFRHCRWIELASIGTGQRVRDLLPVFDNAGFNKLPPPASRVIKPQRNWHVPRPAPRILRPSSPPIDNGDSNRGRTPLRGRRYDPTTILTADYLDRNSDTRIRFDDFNAILTLHRSWHIKERGLSLYVYRMYISPKRNIEWSHIFELNEQLNKNLKFTGKDLR